MVCYVCRTCNPAGHSVVKASVAKRHRAMSHTLREVFECKGKWIVEEPETDCFRSAGGLHDRRDRSS